MAKKNRLSKQEILENKIKTENERKNGERIRLQEVYFTNKFNAEYTVAKINMIAEQLDSGKIVQTFDGYPKTKEMLIIEYKSLKKAALGMAREAYFNKKRLIEEFGYTEETLSTIEKDIIENPVFRDKYSETDRRIGNKRVNGE